MAAMLVFIHSLTSILAEKFSSMLGFFEIEFDNQYAKKFQNVVFHLPLERCLAVQTWTSNPKPDGKVLIT